MIATWQLSEARDKFSELIDRAVSDGPQIVTRCGEEVVVVLSREDYDRLTRDRSGLVDFFRRSPLAGVELDLDREKPLPGEWGTA